MIDTLTSLRFFAVVFIFLSHLGFFTQYENLKSIFNNCFYEGYFAVTFFFLLSGFVLCYNYYSKLNDISLEKIISFTKKRLAHVYPIHIITFLISIPLLYKDILMYPLKNIFKAILNIMLLQSFIPKQSVYFSYNVVSWNLSSLLLFYILFPIILVLVKRITKDGCGKLALMYIFIFIIIELVFASIFKSNSYSHWLLYISPFIRLIDCTIGMLLSVIYFQNKECKVNLYVINILELISLLALAMALINFKYINQSYRYGIYYMPFLCFIIYIYAFQKGVISKGLKNRTLVYLGTISYSFYMIHKLVLKYVGHINLLKKYPISMALMSFCISLIAAQILYKYLEKPLRKKINLN